LNKPINYVVTPGATYDEASTLVGWLVERYGKSIREACVQGHRPGIVHRLDKDTSGVMVIAKNLETFLHLTAQFATRTVQKEYKAVCWGNVEKTLEKHNGSRGSSFTIEAPIGRNPHRRTLCAVVKDGKYAKTMFTIDSVFQYAGQTFTSISAQPQTGRTHQIRVHLKSIGHSILGDNLYQKKSEKQLLDTNAEFASISTRMYLHAHSLSFIPPHETQEKTFKSPIPWDIMNSQGNLKLR